MAAIRYSERTRTGVGGALVGVFWAYHGWMNFAPIAEEVKNPHRNIPLAALTGVGIIILLYLGVNLAYLLTIPSAEIAQLDGRTVAGEFALCRSQWRITGTDRHGNPLEVHHHGMELMRRLKNGEWGFYIDHPWGADASWVTVRPLHTE